jgi:hypothetical protein
VNLQPRDQPQRGEARGGGERKLARTARCAQLVGRRLQALQHVGGDAVEREAALRQRQRALPPLEQRDAEMILQRLDLPADGRLCDEQLFGCLGEAQVPGSRLETLDEAQLRQAVASVWHSQNSCFA